MIFDLNEAESSDQGHFDVCVIGAGPAGISLALHLSKNKRVALCEAGGEEWSEESQGCYKGRVIGDPYYELDSARLRYFGGTSGHWAGWCRTLDQIDFKKKNYHPLAHWPINKTDLDKYLEEANKILEIPPFPEDRVLSKQYGIKAIHFNFSPPVRFGEKYRTSLRDSGNIELFLNSNLISLEVSDRRVNGAHFRSYSGNELAIRASQYVFAMGGIENSRQLLWHQRRSNEGLYDQKIPVGRYWMVHPRYLLGEALVGTDIVNQRFYSLTADKQMDLEVLNCRLNVQDHLGRGTKRLIKELLCVAPAIGERMAELAERELVCGVTIEAEWEQSPDYQNRIELSKKERDIFGVPATELFWRKLDLDRRTVLSTVTAFNDWLMNSDFGRLKLHSWILRGDGYPLTDTPGGPHHMGGTRMADSPEYGVVDKDCKVYGSKNLYIAGSSVFPTGGHATPTLTILQLALRLAGHLNSK